MTLAHRAPNQDRETGDVDRQSADSAEFTTRKLRLREDERRVLETLGQEPDPKAVQDHWERLRSATDETQEVRALKRGALRAPLLWTSIFAAVAITAFLAYTLL